MDPSLDTSTQTRLFKKLNAMEICINLLCDMENLALNQADLLKYLDMLTTIFYDNSNILKDGCSIEEKLILIRWSIHGIIFFVNKYYKRHFYEAVVVLLESMIFFALSQEISLYRDVMREIFSLHSDIITVCVSGIILSTRSINRFKATNRSMHNISIISNVITIETNDPLQRLSSVLCDTLDRHLSTMIMYNVANDKLVKHFILCFTAGDFHLKTVALSCLIKVLFESSQIKIHSIALFDVKETISMIRLLIGSGILIVNQNFSKVTQLESGCDFQYQIFENRWLSLFHSLMKEVKTDPNMEHIVYKELVNFVTSMETDAAGTKLNDVSWSMMSCFCEILSEFKRRSLDDTKKLYIVCKSVLQQSCNNFQFRRAADLLVSIVTEYKSTVPTLQLTSMIDLNNTWKGAYCRVIGGDASVPALDRLLSWSKLMNILMLNKRSVCISTKTDVFHMCSMVDPAAILDPVFLESVVANNSATKLLDLLAVFVAEFNISDHPCKWSHDQWKVIAHLCHLVLPRKEREISADETIHAQYARMSQREYPRETQMNSFHILSYLPFDLTKQIKQSAFDIIVNFDLRERELLLLFESTRNCIIIGMDAKTSYDMIDSIFTKFKDALVPSVTLTEEFFKCLEIIQCRMVGAYSKITRSLGLRTGTESGFIFNFVMESQCNICCNRSNLTAKHREVEKMHLKLLELILKVINYYLERHLRVARHHAAMRSILSCLFSHCSTKWKEQSLKTVLLIIQGCLSCPVSKIQIDCGFLLEVFVRNMSSNVSIWLHYQSAICQTIDDVVCSNIGKDTESILWSVETLLKHSPMSTNGLLISIVCKLAFVEDKYLISELIAIIRNVSCHRSISREQFFDDCKQIVAEYIYIYPATVVVFAEKLSMIFGIQYSNLLPMLLAQLLMLLAYKDGPDSITQMKTILGLFEDEERTQGRLIQMFDIPGCIVYFFSNMGQDKINGVKLFIRTCFDISLEKMVTMMDVTKTIHTLMLNLSHNYISIRDCITWIITNVLNMSSEVADGQCPTIQTFLSEHAVGILYFFKRSIVEANISTIKIEQYVTSLDLFIHIIEKEGLRKVYLMYFAILKICLQFDTSSLNDKVYKLWMDFFILSEIPDLVGLLVESIAVLITKKDTSMEKITEILRFVFSKIDDSHDALCKLHFILDYPDLVEFHQKLKTIILKHEPLNDTFISLIKYCTQNLKHDNGIVRQLAAKHLSSVLSSDTDKLIAFMSVFKQESETNMENMELIHGLTSLLLAAVTRSVDKGNATVFGRCLGLLGAVDPGRYRELTLLNTISQETNDEFLDSPRFSFNVMLELGKVYFGMSTSFQMDASGIAIQELIKTFGINRGYRSTNLTLASNQETNIHYALSEQLIVGNTLWDMFETKFKDIFVTFFKTRYVHVPDDRLSNIRPPIFEHNESMEFNYWICMWTAHLINRMKHPRHISIFRHFITLVQVDEHFARYILPYVVFVMIVENDVLTVLDIRLELTTVLDAIGFSKEGEKQFEENLLNTSCHLLSSQAQNEEETVQTNSWVLQSAGQIVFSILDYLKLWLSKQANVLVNLKGTSRDIPDINYLRVKDFVKSISKESLAIASYKCGSYARSLNHWLSAYRDETKLERNLLNRVEKRKRIISGILQTHAALHERDEISGYLSAFKSDLEPFAQTLQLEYEGKYDLVLALHEQRLQEHKIQENNKIYSNQLIDLYQSIFRAQMMNLGSLPSVVSRVECCLNDENFPVASYEALNICRIEALYKLGDWKRLEQALQMEDNCGKNWAVATSKVLCDAKNQYFDNSKSLLDIVWKQQLTKLDLSAIEGGNYERVHDDLSKLSMLTDIEKAISTGSLCLDRDVAKNFRKTSKMDLHKLKHFFKERYKLAECSFQNQESLLTLRYNLFQLIHEAQMKVNTKSNQRSCNLVKNEISEIWLQRCKICRRSSQYSSALACLVNVKEIKFVESLIERGKLFWKQGRLEEALACLDKGISDLAPHEVAGNYVFRHSHDTSLYWKMVLLRARLSEINCRYDVETTKTLYRSVFRFNSKSEEAHFRLARFLDGNMKLAKSHNEDMLANALEEYGEALVNGSKFVYQSMPRLLSLWLDRPIISSKMQCLATDRVTKVMTKNINQIPKFQFYICLSQILSRLCHETKKDVTDLLYELVIKIFVSFPKQTVWSLMSLEGSTYSNRRSRFNTFMERIKDKGINLIDYVNKVVELCKALRQVSELVDNNKSKEIRIERSARDLHNLLKTRDYSDVIIPLHHQLSGTLHSQSTFSPTYSPFPSTTTCLVGIEDTVVVIPSLTKPKKMVWNGSDGKQYIIVAKPKDDLRRDSRIMELNGMLNQLMLRTTETRHRLLYIRTYAVTPLGEQGGLIEWVNNTNGFRNIILDIYAERKIDDLYIKMKPLFPLLEDSNEIKHRKYCNDVLPIYPRVFHSWFLSQFPDPSNWYRSLQRFTRSTAVMSMVGYVLGLGDRHGENILLDRTNGDIVHIDFNCLFNAGLTLQWPEMVPFRLTRNMQDALGPCREKNGLFRSSCEATMRLLRDEIEPIMAVFRPMYHDTLIEIKEPRPSKTNKQMSAVSLTETQLEQMELRLRGNVNNSHLSVEGQVSHLLRQAVDERLLCQMYIGWAAFI